MATGMARGALERGRRVAFGDGQRIIWSTQSNEVFKGNPNIAPPGVERTGEPLEWINHYRGHRLYAESVNGFWRWNLDFRPTPGEVFLTQAERDTAARLPPGYVIIEPCVKNSAPNKQWPKDRYAEVSRRLLAAGYPVAQFQHSTRQIDHRVTTLPAKSFREALAFLERAALYIGPEGGLHHGAAAMNIPAVVIFGGFISPTTTGYDFHTNIFTGGQACGTIARHCLHCREALDLIKADYVAELAINRLKGKTDALGTVAPVVRGSVVASRVSPPPPLFGYGGGRRGSPPRLVRGSRNPVG